MINWAKVPVGKSARLHAHETMDEIFIVVSGFVRFTIQEKTEELSKGDAVFVQRKEVHGMKNIGEEDVEYVVIGIV